MFLTIDEELDTNTLHFSYLNTPQLGEIGKIYRESVDIIISFTNFNHPFNQIPFKYDKVVHEPILHEYYQLLTSFGRIIKKTGTLYIYGSPQILPYLSVFLNKQGWQFKYWLTLETHHPEPSPEPIIQTHEGILLYVKNKNKFNLRKVRSPHQKCDICGDFTADWGGKSHLRNSNGYVISDVWDDLTSVKDQEHILSKEVWQRLILLTANDHSNILCAAYNGEQNLGQYIFS